MSDAVSGPEAGQRERDLERFLTFVDAIVAIAITLLVLPLVDVAGHVSQGESVTSLLHEHAPHIGAFFLSFAVISNLWLAQHQTLRHVVAADQRVTRLLLLWTLTIVVLPSLVAATAFALALVLMLLCPVLSHWPLLLLAVRRVPRRRPAV